MNGFYWKELTFVKLELCWTAKVKTDHLGKSSLEGSSSHLCGSSQRYPLHKSPYIWGHPSALSVLNGVATLCWLWSNLSRDSQEHKTLEKSLADAKSREGSFPETCMSCSYKHKSLSPCQSRAQTHLRGIFKFWEQKALKSQEHFFAAGRTGSRAGKVKL